MERHIFSVWDQAANLFLDPFVAPSIEMALRGFRQVVNQEGHQFNDFPEDYTLFHIGEFEMESGWLKPCDPRNLGVAVTFIERLDPGPALERDG